MAGGGGYQHRVLVPGSVLYVGLATLGSFAWLLPRRDPTHTALAFAIALAAVIVGATVLSVTPAALVVTDEVAYDAHLGHVVPSWRRDQLVDALVEVAPRVRGPTEHTR